MMMVIRGVRLVRWGR